MRWAASWRKRVGDAPNSREMCAARWLGEGILSEDTLKGQEQNVFWRCESK